MATPDSLYKFVSVDAARQILADGTLRWYSPELLDNPWFVGHTAELGFDHMMVNKAMLTAAVSMIFARDMPPGNKEHPLYKAICRWRSEDRFNDENEAYEALSELLAPTPDTLREKLKNITKAWRDVVSNSRVVCFSESPKDMLSWQQYANQHRGLVLRFDCVEALATPKPVEYTNQRPHLTTIREQVNDLVGIEKAVVQDKFQSKLLTQPKYLSHEKEWRCIQLMAEEDLDCGEDVEDWYMDEPFPNDSLRAVYLGFKMSQQDRQTISQLIQTGYPTTAIYTAKPVDEQFEVEFEKLSCEPSIG